MFNAATVSEIIHDAKQFGFEVESFKFNWKKLKDARDAYIVRLNNIYSKLLGNSKVTTLNGLAKFSGPNSIEVNGQIYTADNILIAVGGKPYLPSDLEGVEYCISSDGFFALEQQPERVAVVGGGYIGIELAGVFNGLGTKTEIFTRSDRPLRGFDTMIVDTLLSEMKKQGLTYRPCQNPKKVTRNLDGSYMITTDAGDSFGPYDKVSYHDV